jgi:phospholipid transport system transporter-binding protein
VNEPAAAFQLAAAADGALRAQGPLTFATARAARLAGLAALQAAPQAACIDCAGVTSADSAGLAVLLDWLAAGLAKRSLKFASLPEDLIALARISEIEPLLTQGV